MLREACNYRQKTAISYTHESRSNSFIACLCVGNVDFSLFCQLACESGLLIWDAETPPASRPCVAEIATRDAGAESDCADEAATFR
jgi:hypothetical protein